MMEVKTTNTEEIVQLLNSKKCTIEDLKPESAIHRNAVYQYIKQNPNKLASFNSDKEKLFMNACLDRDIRLFIYLKPEQYAEEYAVKFLESKLANEKTPNFIKKSFNEKLMLQINYETCSGEEVFYFDNDLNISSFLIAKISALYRIVDTVKFFNKIDISVRYIGFNSVYYELTKWLKNAYRKVISDLLESKKLGIYSLNAKYEEIEQSIQDELNKKLEEAGVIMQEVSIAKLSMSKDASIIIERQGLELLNERQRKDAQVEYEKRALDNYERKAKIHSENPSFEQTLTEAEKDLALSRYIKRFKVEKGEEEEELLNNRLSDRKSMGSDGEMKKVPDKVPKYEQQETSYTWVLVLLGLVALVIGFAMIGKSIGTFLILFGVAVGFIGAGIARSLKKSENSPTNKMNVDAENAALELEYREKLKQ